MISIKSDQYQSSDRWYNSCLDKWFYIIPLDTTTVVEILTYILTIFIVNMSMSYRFQRAWTCLKYTFSVIWK